MATVLVSALVSIVIAIITSLVTVTQMRRQYQLEMRAEELVRRLLQHKKWRLRTFPTIHYHVAGFGEDELRRILIRAGAVRFTDAKGVEVWGLLERVGDLLDIEVGTTKN